MTDIIKLLGNEAESLLAYQCKGIPKDMLHLPGPDFVDRVVAQNDRTPGVLRSSADPVRPRPAGRHGLPVDPAGGPGHRALGRRLVRPQPDLLRPGEHRQAGHRGRLQRGGLDPGRAGFGGAQVRAQDPVHRQDQPQRAADLPGQSTTRPCSPASSRRSTWARWRWARRSTSARPNRAARSWRSARPSPMPTSSAWPRCCGATCATPASRRTASTTTPAADLTGQANHLGVTIEADIIKQKQAENNGGYKALKFGKTHPKVYCELTSDHPIDLCATRWPTATWAGPADQLRRRLGRGRPGARRCARR